MDSLVKLGCPTPDQIDALAGIKASRDILVHNQGIVNETYLAKAGAMARATLGEKLEIDDAYHRRSWEMIRKVVEEVSTAVAKA